jgi:hypothetical protein
MLGVYWMLVCYGSMDICTKRRMASGLKEVSVGGAGVQPLSQFSCRSVYADRIAERVEQLALSRMKQSQMELWSVRQQRLWASDVSGRLRNPHGDKLSVWILWEWWVELAEVRSGGIDQGVSNIEAGHSPMASHGNGQGVMGWVFGAVQNRHTVTAAGVLTGMVAGQLYLWLLLCWVVCKGKGCYIWWLLPMLLPGAYGMEGVPDGVSDELPVIVSAILAAVEVGGELPEWFDLGAWVAEKDEWELSWGRLVDWVGGQQAACVSLTGLEARLRSMYEWLVRQQDVSHRYKEVCEAARQWEDDTGETLVWFGPTHSAVFTWGGQILP